MTAVRLLDGRTSVGEVTRVLCDVFAEYPVMRHVLGDRGDYAARLRVLIGLCVGTRVLQGDAILGISKKRVIALWQRPHPTCARGSGYGGLDAGGGIGMQVGRHLPVGPLAGSGVPWLYWGMKTAISLPDELFRAGDALAKRLKVSRSELYARALGEYLAKHRADQVTQRLNTVYAAEDSRLDPGFEALQTRSLPRETW